METVNRFFNAPTQSYFLFGPRGVGKTTWIEGHYPSALWIDFLDPDTLLSYSIRPARLWELIEGNPSKTAIVIDEVQKVPEILDVVHAIIEKKRDIQFVLTGSNARKLKSAGVNLLGGRALLRSLHPFMAAELGDSFSLDVALQIGLIPIVRAAKDPVEFLRSYAALYIRQEVQVEGLVRRINSFSRFLEAVSFSHGSVISVANIARECGAERNTVEGYIQILEDLLMCSRLPVFSKRAARAVSSHPKFYLFDAGVFRTLRAKGPLDAPSEIDGAALEGLVYQHLRAWRDYSQETHDIYFWRTRSGVEVDFVVYGPQAFWAIEVKNGNKIHSKDLAGLKAFKEDYPQCTPILLYRGQEQLLVEGILCQPCERFLADLKPDVYTSYVKSASFKL